MTLNEIRTTVINALSIELTTWNIATSAVPFAQDKLIEVVWLDTNVEMIEMSSVAMKGNLGVVLYRKFGESYDEMIDAIEIIAELLPSLDLGDSAIGNQTPVLASISSPSVTSDGRTDYRAIVMAIPIEVII